MTIFRLDASIRRQGSTTRALGDLVEQAATEALSDRTVTRRDVGLSPLEGSAWSSSVGAAGKPEHRLSEHERRAVRLATTLADELADADGYVFAAPLYNWGVSQHLKTWFDIVVTDPRFSPRSTTIAGRPAVLVTARGGDYRAGSARADWDHGSDWLRASSATCGASISSRSRSA